MHISCSPLHQVSSGIRLNHVQIMVFNHQMQNGIDLNSALSKHKCSGPISRQKPGKQAVFFCMKRVRYDSDSWRLGFMNLTSKASPPKRLAVWLVQTYSLILNQS